MLGKKRPKRVNHGRGSGSRWKGSFPWSIFSIVMNSLRALPVAGQHTDELEQQVQQLKQQCEATTHDGKPVRKGAVDVIAPGTGLGESFLTWDGSQYVAHSSENGYSDFAPTDERQIRLLEYMLKLFDHVSFEHVCSGIGIPNIYWFLRDVEHIPEDPEVAELIDAAGNLTAVIVTQAVDYANRRKLCAETIDLFVSILISEAGNVAVTFLATGGSYLAGGVAVHALEVIKQPSFLEHFERKDVLRNS